MTVELFFSNTWIVIVAAFVASINYVAVWIVFIGVKQWREELAWWNASDHKTQHPDFNTTVWISALVVAAIDFVMLGVMNVGQATELLSDPNVLTGVSWLFGSVLAPLILGRAMNKYTNDKFGTASREGGATP